LTLGTYLTGTSYNGSGAVTAAVDATSANTASKVVARDASGNFSAGTITAALSGNATTATTAANVNNGTLTMNVSGTGLSGSQTFTANQSGNATFTVTSNATNANTASTIVARDASGNFSAGTITAALSGNASTATTATNQSGGTVSATTGAFSSTVSFAGGSSVASNGDFTARRSSGTTGVYYFVDGSKYLYFDGTNFTLQGGSFTSSGNVTAYSDERVKTNWRGYGPDFVERLAKIKHGTFDRTDTEITQDGVSAQSLQELLPYSVMEDTEGKLSVSYGNAALVAAVKLAERVVALEARLAALEAKG
jgi:hypothetical protein